MRNAIGAGLILICSVLGQQTTNPLTDAEQMLKASPPQWDEAERLLRGALARNPSDAAALEKLTLLLVRKAGKGSESAAEAQRHADLLLRLRESPGARPAELALALEMNGHLLSKVAGQAEMHPSLARAAGIRKSLVIEAQPPSVANSGVECLKAGGEVRPPRLIHKGEPEYSDEARIAKHQGAAVFLIVVDGDGRPKNLRLSRSLGFGLDEKAVAALQTWRFEPGQRLGQPVPVCAQVEVNFRLL